MSRNGIDGSADQCDFGVSLLDQLLYGQMSALIVIVVDAVILVLRLSIGVDYRNIQFRENMSYVTGVDTYIDQAADSGCG